MIAFIYLLLLPLVSTGYAEVGSDFEHKMHFEHQVIEQIAEDLSGLVDPEDYKITAVASFEKVRQRSQQVVETNKGGNQKILPGFQQLPQTGRGEKSSVTYTEVNQLKALSLYVFINKNLSEAVTQILNDYFQNKWVGPNPEVVHVAIQSWAFETLASREPALWQREPWLLLAAAILLGLMMMALLLRRGRAETSVNIHGETSPNNHTQEVAALDQLHGLKKTFVQEAIETPLFARGYLASLEVAQQEKLLACFHPYIREAMAHWVGVEVDDGEAQEIDAELLKNALEELQEHKKMRQKQFSLQLGFLPDLSDEELAQLLEGENLETLAAILHYVQPRQSSKLIAQLSVADQLRLTELMSVGNGKEQIVAEADRSLRQKYQQLAEKLLVWHLPKQSVLESLLSHSVYSPQLVEQILSKQPQLKNVLEKYRYGFDYLFEQEVPVMRQILGAVDNEVLLPLLTILDEAQRVRLEKALSRERRKILEGLRKSVGHEYSAAEINEAKTMVTHAMRETLFR